MMQFESLAEFVAMGKHGVFVWSSYAVFVVILAVNIIQPLLRKRDLVRRLQRIEKRAAAGTGGTDRVKREVSL